jgi:hypothetical protein
MGNYTQISKIVSSMTKFWRKMIRAGALGVAVSSTASAAALWPHPAAFPLVALAGFMLSDWYWLGIVDKLEEDVEEAGRLCRSMAETTAQLVREREIAFLAELPVEQDGRFTIH